MDNHKVSFFLPTRKGSQRVINKNTRPFAGIPGGLLQNKLEQLVLSEKIDEIVLSTNDEECIAIAESVMAKSSKIVIDKRPEALCLDTTNLKDLIDYVPSVVGNEHIVWGHVTTPLADATDYDAGISAYLKAIKEGYNSLIGVCGFKNFLLNDKGTVINNTTSLPWPRTQDLQELYEVNHTMFIASKKVYADFGNRVGDKPYLHVMDKIKSFDVDWEEDFKIAEILYEKHTGL